MTRPTPIDIPALLDATADLECGHPIEAVLRAHGIPERHSAYDVVHRYERNLEFARSAISDHYRKSWKAAAAELRPVVVAIAEHLAANTTTGS